MKHHMYLLMLEFCALGMGLVFGSRQEGRVGVAVA